MTNFGWWYPPGAENDPNAPYNQTDEGPSEIDCEACKGTGKILDAGDDEDQAYECDDCNGTGVIEVPYEKPERDPDDARDEAEDLRLYYKEYGNDF